MPQGSSAVRPTNGLQQFINARIAVMLSHKKTVGVVGIQAFYHVVFIFFSEMDRRLPIDPKVGCT